MFIWRTFFFIHSCPFIICRLYLNFVQVTSTSMDRWEWWHLYVREIWTNFHFIITPFLYKSRQRTIHHWHSSAYICYWIRMTCLKRVRILCVYECSLSSFNICSISLAPRSFGLLARSLPRQTTNKYAWSCHLILHI